MSIPMQGGNWRSLRELVRNPRAVLGGAALLPIGVVFLHQAVDFGTLQGFGVVLPEITRDFSLNLQRVTQLVSVATVLALCLGLPLATLADGSGHRVWWLAAGTLTAAFFLGATALAPNVVLFFTFQIVLFLALRVTLPVRQSLLADYSPLDARATIFSGLQIAQVAAFGLFPLLFGVLATLFGWRPALVSGSAIALVVGAVTFRLREPARGAQERRSMGILGPEAEIEESPPTFDEAVQVLKGIGTVRRLWYSIPFFVGGITSLQLFLPLFYDQVFHLNPAARGAITAASEPFGIVGLILGIPIATGFLQSGHPERLFSALALAGTVSGALILGIALSPNLVVLIALRCAFALSVNLLLPGLFTAFSLVFPPRARTVGFALTSLCAFPGILYLAVMGGIANAHGPRWGLGIAGPVFVAGAYILASGGTKFRADMIRARVTALAGLESRRARMAGKPKLLVCRSVDVAYGHAQVLFGVNFDVAEGEMVALLGTNGAGKSTLLAAISGTVVPTGGAIFYDGRDITSAGAAQTAELGIVQVPGGHGIFPTLTVAENLRVATWLCRKDQRYVEDSLQQVLRLFPVLKERQRDVAGNLSGGEQQMLALGQAFIARPKLLMIDELSLGLAPTVVQRLLEVVRGIHDRGTTVILVEQSVNVALSLCERAVFLEKGEVRFEGRTANLLDRPDILRSVFLEGAVGPGKGGSARGSGRTRPADEAIAAAEQAATPALEGRHIVKRFGGIHAVDDVSIALGRGEILGLIGANGAGKTTLVDVVSGYLTADVGTVFLEGEDVTSWGPDRRARARLGRSFQTARLFPSLTVAETLAVALERHLEVRDPLSAAFALPAARDSEIAMRARVEELIELMKLGAFRDKFISELSTGSRRIVDIACTMAHDPSVLLLDEPSSGIAQRETEALAPVLLRVREETGASLLVIEHDMPLVSAIADRLIALETGRVISSGSPQDVLSDPAVIASYLGTDDTVLQRSGSTTSTSPPVQT
jgi:ABC-type branched-subunit amino acid transport system ATPase component/MFS family permease